VLWCHKDSDDVDHEMNLKDSQKRKQLSLGWCQEEEDTRKACPAKVNRMSFPCAMMGHPAQCGSECEKE
jgi:hypothetical protein